MVGVVKVTRNSFGPVATCGSEFWRRGLAIGPTGRYPQRARRYVDDAAPEEWARFALLLVPFGIDLTA